MADSSGVVVPEVNGKRSTSALGRAVVSDALQYTDAIGADAALRETDWRRRYVTHLSRLVEAAVVVPGAAETIARDGLTSFGDRMQLQTGAGEQSLSAELPDVPGTSALTSCTIAGTAMPETELSIPYDGTRLRGDALLAQVDTWVSSGAMEPSAGEAIRRVVAHPEWLSLPGRKLVALGAASEMGPLQSILRWGGHVVAIDLPRTGLWDSVLTTAAASAGSLTVPMPVGSAQVNAEYAGADLLHGLPQIAQWLADEPGELVLGNYVYADGALNLRLSAATDRLATHLLDRRSDVGLAFLATPTDVFAVPADAVRAATTEYDRRTMLRRLRPLARTLSGGRLLQRNYAPDSDPGLNDSIVPQQGPNYLLAKRIHRWRATAARADGRLVSMNVAPPTRTRSVTKNKALAAAYAGAHKFGVQVFAPATSASLMAALLVDDLYADQSPAPMAWQDEAASAVHGGLWRTAYDPRSALGIAVVLGVGNRA